LLWANDQRIAPWLLRQESSISPEKAKFLLSDYIHTIVSRYKGKITSWDVINEAVDVDPNNPRPFNLRDCFWYRKLGQDFIKYAFLFAYQADPQVQLYYNDYHIEEWGMKSSKVLQLLTWVRSQGIPVHGIGMQWHTGLWVTLRPQDSFYHTAQTFIDNGFDIMITELDVSLTMNGSVLQNPNDLLKQASLYRSIVQYALNFRPKLRALITWGFTDLYSWIPLFSNYTRGAALPTDENYQPKPAYWEMQEELARVLPNGIYRLVPESQSDKCLGIYENGHPGEVQIYTEQQNNPNQMWNLAWLGDGSYQLIPKSHPTYALTAHRENTTSSGVNVEHWHSGNNQRWILSPVTIETYRIAPRTVWQRALSIGSISNVYIHDYIKNADQNWMFIKL
ncbi:unnamed protein product, partial [Rotaria sp. Silwood1]